MSHRLSLPILAFASLLAIPACSQDPSANVGVAADRCVVSHEGETYDGNCRTDGEPAIGLGMVRSDQSEFVPGIIAVTLTQTAPGLGEVYALGQTGNEIYLGSVQQETSEPACWRGSSLRICRY